MLFLTNFFFWGKNKFYNKVKNLGRKFFFWPLDVAAKSDRPFQIWTWNQSRWLSVISSCTTVTTTEPNVMRAPQRREARFPLLQCALRASSFSLQAGARVFLSPVSPRVTSLSPLAQPKIKSWSWNCPKYRTENRTWPVLYFQNQNPFFWPVRDEKSIYRTKSGLP